MKNKVHIRISIGERIYPMRIDPKEEETIRKIAKKLNDDILSLSKKFKVGDRQDILAMVAFDVLLSSEREKENFSNSEKKIDRIVEGLDEILI